MDVNKSLSGMLTKHHEAVRKHAGELINDQIEAAIGSLQSIPPALQQWGADDGILVDPTDGAYKAELAESICAAFAAKQLTVEQFLELTGLSSIKPSQPPIQIPIQTTKGATMPTIDQVMVGQPDKVTHVQGVPASNRYSTTKTLLRSAENGLPIFSAGKAVEMPSEAEYARIGAWLRAVAYKQSGGAIRALDNHEKSLIHESRHDRWVGNINSEYSRDIDGEIATKAILSDATSGGQEINPALFDDAIVAPALLLGEVFPFVDVVNAPRAKSVEGATIGIPTATWGTADGTEMPLFTTTGLIADLSTSFYPVHVSLEIGKDMMDDTPVDLAQILIGLIGQRMMSELDKVACIGTGSQPQGIFNASGVASVASVNGTSGPLTVGDAEMLVFSIGKQYRKTGLNPSFLMSDTTYRRFRSIAVDDTDARRIFGMDHQSYMLLEYPVRICNSIDENLVAFGALKYYRMWRRLGSQVTLEGGGKTLVSENKVMLLVRGRWGGKVTLGEAFGKMVDAPIVEQ